MARLNIISNAKVNFPPSRLGTKTISVDHGAFYVLKSVDFTTTIPTYQHPDNNAPYLLKVKSLPVTGTLEYNNIEVTVGQEISFSAITTGLLIYTADTGTDTAYVDSFTFDIADTGSHTFSELTGTIKLNVIELINLPPSQVGDNTKLVSYNTTTVFTRADFTTETIPVYIDPEGDAADSLQILVLPTEGDLKYLGSLVTKNQIIPFTGIDAGDFIYVSNGDTTGYDTYFDFAISDTGSQQFIS